MSRRLRRGSRLSYPRIPFAEAIADDRLFKRTWTGLHPEQRAILKMVYGLPLDEFGLPLWHALNGGALTDDLGYLTGVTDCGLPPPTEEAEEVTFIVGRRGTKTSISSFIIAYEALCGGHKAHLKKALEQPIFLQIAQDLDTARTNLRHILGYLQDSPVGVAELGNVQRSVTADEIRLTNCGLITVGPPTIKLRGKPVAICAMDELAFWQKDRESAAPDYEVEAAVIPGMTQFPHRKLLKMSTPWTKAGLLWIAQQVGTYGRHLDDAARRAAYSRTLVLKAPTAVVNPTLSGTRNPRAFLGRRRAKDGDAFRREYLAEFSDSVSGFLPVSLLQRAVDPHVRRRPVQPGIWYTGAIDPAFRRDAFAMSIGHLEGDNQFVQDLCVSWRGTTETPLDPGVIIPVIGQLAAEYRLTSVLSDQYHQESLQTLSQQAGFLIEPFTLTPKSKNTMWRDFITLLHQDKVRLLDHDELLAELSALEKTLTPNGTERIAGRRDDLAVVTALCLHRALSFGVSAPTTTKVAATENDWAKFASARVEAGLITRPRVPKWWTR